MKKMLTMLSVVVGLFVFSGCGAAAVYNIQNNPVEVKKGTQNDAVYKAIKNAGLNLGWIVRKVKDGEATAKIALRSHVANVRITYDASSYSITYLNSTNLRYNEADNTIHNNYNGWIQNFEKAINVQLSTLAE